jgi:hypothetical protein
MLEAGRAARSANLHTVAADGHLEAVNKELASIEGIDEAVPKVSIIFGEIFFSLSES